MSVYYILRNFGVGIILIHFFTITSLVSSSDELRFVVGETRELQITSSLEVKGSPGLKRIHIQGLRWFKHIHKYAHSLNLIVKVSTVGRTSNVDVCFHRNLSQSIGMCSDSQWQKVVKGRSLVQTVSPFAHTIIDVKIVSSSNVTIELSAVQELSKWRLVALILGAVLLHSASTLSKSLTFYYGGGIFVGIVSVLVVVLFQGWKLLPSGRNLVKYPTMLGLGGFVLRNKFQKELTEMGIGEDMYIPLAIFVVVFLVLVGAFWGYFMARKLFLTKDGSIDINASYFFALLFRIAAVFLIYTSSIDRWFAVRALISVILLPSILKKITRLRFLLRIYEILTNMVVGLWEAIGNADLMQKSPDASGGMREAPPSESDTFPSTFHKTPERSKLTKEEWKKLTEVSTRKAVQELVSSPDFGKWAAANADRINVTSRNESSRSKDPPGKWLRWF